MSAFQCGGGPACLTGTAGRGNGEINLSADWRLRPAAGSRFRDGLACGAGRPSYMSH